MNPDLNKLWLELNEDIGRYVCNKVDHQDYCHDILHDVYLKMIDNVEKIKSVDNVKAYLVRISSNTIIDHYRSSKTIASVPVPEEQEVEWFSEPLECNRRWNFANRKLQAIQWHKR